MDYVVDAGMEGNEAALHYRIRRVHNRIDFQCRDVTPTPLKYSRHPASLINEKKGGGCEKDEINNASKLRCESWKSRGVCSAVGYLRA